MIFPVTASSAEAGSTPGAPKSSPPSSESGDASTGASIQFDLTDSGRTSLAIYDAGGSMVRTLLSAEELPKGTHTVTWDGLDTKGHPLAPGSYSWRLITGPGLKSEWLFSLGTNVGTSPWPGQHMGITSVLVSGDSLFAVAPHAEGVPSSVCASLDGSKVEWFAPNFEAWDSADDLGLCGNTLFVLYKNSGNIYLMDKRSGELLRRANPDTGNRIASAERSRTTPVRKDVFSISRKLKTFVFGDPALMNEPDAMAVSLEGYDASKGYGWASHDGLQVMGTTGSAKAVGVDRKEILKGDDQENLTTFIIDLPAGWYRVRVYMGTGEKAFPNSGVWAQDTWKVTSNVPAWTPRETPPQAATQEFPVEVEDKHNGQLKLGFRNKLGSLTSWALRGITIEELPAHMDAADSELVVGFPSSGEVQWLSPEDGSLLDSAKGPAMMRDLKILATGQVAILTKDSLVTLGRNEKKPSVKVTGLDEARTLAVDPSDGGAFIAEWGETQQVSKYDNAFKRVKTFGRKGGRLPGLYVPENFSRVSGLSADGHGGFVVAEADQPPRRTGHFDSDGHLVHEWYGGQQFYTFAAPDPANPNRVWFDSAWGWLVEAEVDWEKRTWKPRACYHWHRNLEPRMFSNYKMGWAMKPIWVDLKGDGSRSLCLWSDCHPGLVLKVDEEKGKLLPIGGLGFAVNAKNGRSLSADEAAQPWIEALKTLGVDVNNAAARNQFTAFSWADQNGDFQVQGGEVVPLTLKDTDGRVRGIHTEYGGRAALIDEDLTIFACRGFGMKNKPIFYKFPSTSRTGTGGPVWNWAKHEAGPINDFDASVGLIKDSKGNFYQLGRGGGDGLAARSTYDYIAHGYTWPATQTDRSGLVKWSPDGKKIWEVGLKAATKNAPWGQMYFPVRIAGLVKNEQFVGVSDKIVKPCDVWTSDGLYVGGMLDDHVADGLGDKPYSWWRFQDDDGLESRALLQYDMLVGGSLSELPNGDVVYYGAGWNNCPVYRISGWENFRRQQGEVQIASAAIPAERKGTGLSGELFMSADLSGAPVVKQTFSTIWFSPQPPAKGQPGASWPDAVKGRPFSGRWTGFIEPEVSEDYRFIVYVGRGAKNIPEQVRLYVDGELVIDGWEDLQAWNSRLNTRPISLVAGQKVPVVLEYVKTGPGELHLNWESRNKPVEHIPQSALYPALP